MHVVKAHGCANVASHDVNAVNNDIDCTLNPSMRKVNPETIMSPFLGSQANIPVVSVIIHRTVAPPSHSL